MFSLLEGKKMKAIIKQFNKRAAFSIIELLTVMSIIVILMSLLVPALAMVKRYAREVRQRAQFHAIEAALELFQGEMDGYPDSDALDEEGVDYCGAMKLCEAMVGQDLLGFHPSSRFRADLEDGQGNLLYDKDPDSTADDLLPNDPEDLKNLQSRKGPYLPLEKANAYRLWHLYGQGNTGPAFGGDREDLFVLCDEYARVTNKETGKKVGMPILYYKADPAGNLHDPNMSPSGGLPFGIRNFYDYEDNHELLRLGKPWDLASPEEHPLFQAPNEREGERFYRVTKNTSIKMRTGRPHREDSYILISAGFDGLYGTEDDIFNF
jgi:type II secretory pathway pseudopilin PulG